MNKINELFDNPNLVYDLTDFELKKILISINDQIQAMTNYRILVETEQEYRMQPYITTKIGFKGKRDRKKPKNNE